MSLDHHTPCAPATPPLDNVIVSLSTYYAYTSTLPAPLTVMFAITIHSLIWVLVIILIADIISFVRSAGLLHILSFAFLIYDVSYNDVP